MLLVPAQKVFRLPRAISFGARLISVLILSFCSKIYSGSWPNLESVGRLAFWGRFGENLGVVWWI